MASFGGLVERKNHSVGVACWTLTIRLSRGMPLEGVMWRTSCTYSHVRRNESLYLSTINLWGCHKMESAYAMDYPRLGVCDLVRSCSGRARLGRNKENLPQAH